MWWHRVHGDVQRSEFQGDLAMPDDGFFLPAEPVDAHVAPTVTRLGTLAELTLGGTVGLDDGLGGAGDTGSLD
jgi:hypothetical protein